ncbi:MAG: sigma-70 family RNA polymerase sigma factor [Clostridia bacterium]|nr:sigma-70 family RNA polymerase sigma factor [Clostridia bacterium]
MAKKVMGINVSELPSYTSKELDSMIKDIKNGKRELRETFLLANVRLVLLSINKFRSSKESPDDLFQVGMIGLMKATDNFDTSLGLKFSTYAMPMILGEIRRFCREGTAFKVGRQVRDIAYKAVKAREKLELLGKEATLTEIAEELELPYYEVISALDALAEPQSVYQEIYGDDGDGVEIIDLVKDPGSDYDYAERITLIDGVKNLPEKERTVIEMRYYQGSTQTEIAKVLDVSQAQVSRLEKGAIERLRTSFQL